MTDTLKRWKKRQAKRKALMAQRQMTTAIDKDRIARAVHQSVCELFHDDGFGRCAHYAVAGATLISVLTNRLYMPQCGSLWVSFDPDDPDLCMAMQAESGGLLAGEFHTWIIGPLDGFQPGKNRMSPDVEIIDLTARHFRRWVESSRKLADRIQADGGQILVFDESEPGHKYLRPDLPYIWCPWKVKPEWVAYQADEVATKLLWSNVDHFSPIVQRAAQLYRRESGLEARP